MTDEKDLNAQRTWMMERCHDYGNKFAVTRRGSSGRIRIHDPVHLKCSTKTYIQCTSDTYPKLTLVLSDFAGQRSPVVVNSAMVPRRNEAMDIPDDPCESERSNTGPSTEPPESAAVEFPLAGRWPGTPFTAIEAHVAIRIPADMMRKNNLCVLQVNGNSMIGDYMLDGDHVIVQRRNTVVDGELVVAKIRNSETTLKRYRRSEGMIELESPNPSQEVKVFDEKDVAIQCVVVGILRKYGS